MYVQCNVVNMLLKPSQTNKPKTWNSDFVFLKACSFFFTHTSMLREHQANSTTLKTHYIHQLPEKKPTPPAVFLPCIAQTKQSCQKDCSHISKPQREHAARTSDAPGQTTTSGVLEQIILRQEANKNQEYRQQGARISDTRLTITFNLLVLSVLN